MISNKLFIKNIPGHFTDNDKHEFFALFGGNDVTSFHGKLKHCCIVAFPDEIIAKKALEVLHQFEILGKRLIVEYAKKTHEKEANFINASLTLNKTNISDTKAKENKELKNIDKIDESFGIAPKLNLLHEFPDDLTYKYPDPNVTILTNIANALASVPKFYAQVLHLMNKMNLPPPFSGLTPSPPMSGDSVQLQDACVDTSDLSTYFSSDESEIESDTEKDKKHKLYQNKKQDTLPPKRKRLKLVTKIDQEKLNLSKPKLATNEVSVESAFDLAGSSKRMEFKLAASIQEAVEGKSKGVSYNVFDERGEFGKIQPTVNDQSLPNEAFEKFTMNVDEATCESEDEESEDELCDEYISLTQLKDNRVTKTEILTMNQFKNYKCGEVSSRLYIKNLAKPVTEKDLHHIFIRFIRKNSASDTDFNIRLMQEGRMKGQAFITFPSSELAEKALKLTHGYLLHSKPMIVQYAKQK